MSNMHYCRFQNTANDLAECLDSAGDNEPLSKSECSAYKRIIQMCKCFLDECPDELPLEQDDDED